MSLYHIDDANMALLKRAYALSCSMRDSPLAPEDELPVRQICDDLGDVLFHLTRERDPTELDTLAENLRAMVKNV